MKKNRLDEAALYRRDANTLFEKADKLKPPIIILIVAFFVTGVSNNFALAGVAFALIIVCLFTAAHFSRQAERSWMVAKAIVRRERALVSKKEAARRRLEAGEIPARGREHRPIVEHADRVVS